MIFMQYCLILFLFISTATLAEEIKPFTTDGCSAFPDGDLENNAKWMQCCIKHDYAYWKGGTKIERETADIKLKQCVAELGENNIAEIMHWGVRIGGEPFYPTWYRWGYGWPYNRGYAPLTKEEEQQVKFRMIELRSLIDGFIEQEN